MVTSQFPEVTFSSTSGFENVTLSFAGGTSQPMVICARVTGGGLNCNEETILTFADPVSDLSFLGTGIDTSSGPVAQVEVFESFVSSGSMGVPGAASSTTPSLVDLSAFSNVTSIRIHSITDSGGIAWDDFTFTPVPEPTTGTLLGLGLLGLAAASPRRRG